MGIQRLMACDGPTCAVVASFPEQQNRILPEKAPKDWIVIKIESWRQVHDAAREIFKIRDGDNTKYFCSPRCMTLFSVVWWYGESAVCRNPIHLELRYLDTDKTFNRDETHV